MADYYLHKTAAHIDELLEKVEGLDNYDDTEVRGLINNKVDKEIGKGLSTNDFTDAYKTELDGLDTALNGKVDKETGKGLSTNDYTTSEKTKLNGIEAGANVNVQVDWDQSTTTADDYIKNKPTIPDAQIQSDWNQTNTESKDFIKNKPTIPEAQVQADWNQTTTTAIDYIKNKPTIPAAQVNADWDSNSGVSQILHKPALGTAAAKDYTTAVSGLSDDLITASAVNTALSTKANLVDGKVPASELPSYVDDTIEGYYYEGAFYEDSSHTTAITGERGKIYVDLTTNKSYRWTGAIYTRVDECPAFGETQGTIYEGNKGKANADAIGTIANLTTTATDLVDAVNELNSGKVDKNGTDSLMTAAEHTKLSGIESGAEVNVQSDWNQTDTTADDYIKNKPSIPSGVVVDQVYDGTSTNAQSGVAIAGALSDKVDKVTGKGLSTNDYTTAEKDKLAGIASGAEVNVQSDWSQSDSSADDYIKNKPTIPAAQVNADWNAVSGVAQILNKPTIPTPVTVDQTYDATSTNAVSGVAIGGKKPGEITTGKQYTISGQTVTAGTGAEAFNDLMNNKASGQYSHAEGNYATASGSCSHAEGYFTRASGICSHAEGDTTIASGICSHAEGSGTAASGDSSHAEGSGTAASGDSSHAEGFNTTAASNYQHVQGKYNVQDSSSTYAFIIGNGTANDARHNAFAVDWNGLIYVNGATTGVNVSQCITPTDYATQNTGGTVKAWTTTDGSDTILHFATQ